MPSWQAYVFSSFLKLTLKRRLKGQRDAARIRQLLTPAPFPLPAGVRITPGEVGGVPGEWVEAGTARSLLLYLHGGGFVACSPETHRPITCYLAKLGFRVFAPNYRLAPENPFPSALNDAIEVFLAMAGDPPLRVALAGDSAGGGLAVSLMLALRDAARPLPKAAALFSPWTDLTLTGASLRAKEKSCALFYADDMPYVVDLYLAGTPPDNPLASPIYAKLNKLPPLLIHAGADETLLDDSIRLAANARQDGVKVQLEIWPVVPHAWQILAPRLPEARRSLKEAAEFLHGS
jgi:monoterpene epsilon-lactone hydrolase